MIHAKENGGDLGAKYKECLEIADKALEDRALAEEIVEKGFGHCAAVKAVCERYKTSPGDAGQSSLLVIGALAVAPSVAVAAVYGPQPSAKMAMAMVAGLCLSAGYYYFGRKGGGEPTGASQGKTAKEIAQGLVKSLDAAPDWPDFGKQWAKGCLAKGDAGIEEAVQGIVGDYFNVHGLKYIRSELRAEIADECKAASFGDIFREKAAQLD